WSADVWSSDLGLDAESTENAAELVDDETLGVPFVALMPLLVPVVRSLDVDALSWTRGGATQARHTTGRAVFSLGQAMHATEALWIRTLLLRVGDRVDPIRNGFQDGIIAGTESHVLRVAKSISDRLPESLDDIGNIGLHRSSAFGSSNNRSAHLFRPESVGEFRLLLRDRCRCH